MLQKVKEYIYKHNMIEDTDRVVVGLSGGPDSVCLMAILCELLGGDRVVAVHINHMIRGEAADGDQEYSTHLARVYGSTIKIYKKDIVAMAKAEGISTEEAGRIYRYECFEQVCKEENCQKIAVAHHENDLAETALFNLIRGSGLQGITGIPATRDLIIRPLLCVARLEIMDYLADNHIQYRIDATNEENDYSRNKIRNIILPTMCDINKNAVGHIKQVSDMASEYIEYVNEIVNHIYTKAVSYKEDKLYINLYDIANESTFIQKKIIYNSIVDISKRAKDITKKHVESVFDLVDNEAGKKVYLAYDVIAQKQYDNLVLYVEDKVDEKSRIIVDIHGEGTYAINNLEKVNVSIVKKIQDYEISIKQYTKTFDYDKIKDTLHIRYPEPDDYFVINKSGNIKKLNRYFIDNKVPALSRDKMIVIAEGHHILWIVGMRISEYYKVESTTENIIEIQYVTKENDYGTEY